ncbi:hypothetical protein NMY22_g11674 [Coprinellus aureogranulatus]|nr:hypothetical protein NMY22_g11674 [Coprinellus aureogranulatus]
MSPTDPSLLRLCSTNTPPTAQEASFILRLMQDLEKEIEDTEGRAEAMGRVGGMEPKVDEMLSQTAGLQARLEQCRKVLSPSRRIPLEILGETFMYLLEEPHTDAFAQMLARLCRVCRHWRNAAHMTPALWSNLSVSVAARGFSFESLNAWLSRSKHIPKTLTLYNYPGCGPTRCRGGERCQFSNPEVAKLLKDGPRLDAFTVACQTPECFENFSASLQASALDPRRPWHSLRSMTILAADWDHWIDFDLSSFLFIPPFVTALSLQLQLAVPL